MLGVSPSETNGFAALLTAGLQLDRDVYHHNSATNGSGQRHLETFAKIKPPRR